MDPDLQLALKLDRELNSRPSPQPTKKHKPSHQKSVNIYKEESIVNPEWEITDPNPDIHMLFQVFDKKYFWGRLDCVEVKWSPRMYSCAGICTYKGKWGGCVISLSLPLLKLRPRKDLIETLLHEMIHAFLFVADKNRDRGEHGPKFHEHMHRINKEAGTKITVYHSFHDEVKHYKQHWWRCNGPCQEWKPFFGLVKRSMNRAPGPNDFWFADHQAKCGGAFIKIKEPENFKSRKRGAGKETKKSEKSKDKGSLTPLTKFFPEQTTKKGDKASTTNSPTSIKSKVPKDNSPTNIKSKVPKDNKPNTSKTADIRTLLNNNSSAKVENYKKINNVHGFTNLSKPGQSSPGNQAVPPKGATGLKSNKGGTLLLNPKSSQTLNDKEGSKNKIEPLQNSFVPFGGTGHVLGSSGASLSESRAKFLDKFVSKSSSSPSTSKSNVPSKDLKKTEQNLFENELNSVHYISDSDDEIQTSHKNTSLVHCPVCNKEMEEHAMNEHLDSCATLESIFEQSTQLDLSVNSEAEEESDLVNCPACGFSCTHQEINDHLDICLK